jgi:NAD(P)H-dependent flavin oxidoreductase YrpB (nitropropane dioxygenase family)
VWCGSVWLTTQEAETHPVVKEKMLRASTSDTVRSRSTTGKPARQLRSAWTDEWADPNNPDPLPMPLQPILIADAQRRVARAAANNEGAEQLVNYFVGQVVGRLNQVKASRQVVMDIVEEFIDSAEQINAILS